MSNQQIDEAILGVVAVRWQKVAMTIVKAADLLPSHFREGEEGYELIARRIEALVQEGRLVGQGNLQWWRYSEVRRA